MRKLIFRIIAALLLLVIIALGIGWAFIDTLAEKGIEKGATYALGVETTVDDVDLSLLKSSLKIEGLNIANPPKFTTPHLMNMSKLETALVASSLIGDTVEVTKFEIDGLDVNIEKEDGLSLQTNVSRIMENLDKLSSGKGKTDEEGSGGKKFKIDRILITNVVVHFHLVQGSALLGDLTKELSETKIEIPQILLTDVTSDNAGGMVMSELTAKVVTAILQAVLQEAENKLPTGTGAILAELRKSVEARSKSLGIGEGLKITVEKKN